ncbi:MAG: OmpA family protein, partial [Treponema sp.]|nr:OmpA family protein [Treponema sp.]
GALIPTKYAVFGASLRLLTSPFAAFPVGNTFSGNLNVSKELYPGMNVGAGLNFGFGTDWTLSADLGFRYNMGRLSFMDDFTWAVVLRNMGKSWTPTAFNLVGGVDFDFLRIAGAENKPDALRLGLSTDLGFPGFTNLTGKLGLKVTVAQLVNISFSTGFNVKELVAGNAASMIPSVGITFHLAMKENTDLSSIGVLNRDGNMAISASARPLYDNIWAIGAGVSWTAGIPDQTPPAITLDYQDNIWISPNNDGKSDMLEFPISISDQRYVAEWLLEIRDESGAIVRTYRNKELRPETQGVRNVINQLLAVKAQVEIPETLRWDGILETGGMAPDGKYFFTLSALDDNGNKSTSPQYEVTLDNTHPAIEVASISEAERIFSPDGDGNKDTLTINQTGSAEDLWDAGFYNAEGFKVKSFDVTNGEAQTITWDGTDDEGKIVADGIYTYKISSIDKALNPGSAEATNIIINTIQPAVSLPIDDAYFSPNANGIKDTMIFRPDVPVTDGITQWTALIKDRSGVTRRTFSGTLVPAEISFDGNDDSGRRLEEASYRGELIISYRNGYISDAQSPVFSLDITSPSASSRMEYNAFSPNNDGKQDEMIFVQNASDEVLWTGEIRTSDDVNALIRSYRFAGLPPSRLIWDGRNDEGGLSEDGNYSYQFFSTDLAGNKGSSIPVTFNLSTADTPLMLTTDKLEFSPNGDRVKDVIVFMPLLQVREGIAEYTLEILDANEFPLRTFEGGSNVPNVFVWDGTNDTGASVPDADYSGRMTVTYSAGNQPTARSQVVRLDTADPQAELIVPYITFSPNGDGNRDAQPFTITTEGNDVWEAKVLDQQDNVIHSWEWMGSAPLVQWDGKDLAGNPMPDGNYRFTLQSTDAAGNAYDETIRNITLDARVPRAFLTESAAAISPKPDEAIRFAIILDPIDGLNEWKLDIKDESGNVIRQFTAPNKGSAVPESIDWNGRNASGSVNEGTYTAALSVNYEKGDAVNVSAGPITVDISGPKLSFTTAPEYFSPDNDGAEDDLFISLSAEDTSSISNWTFEIREPQPPYNLFYKIEGKGAPSERIIWDGRSNTGELVQAATDYPATFTAADSLGNTSTVEAKIGVDVLVIRDGNVLRIQVPSIIFRQNAADFQNIPKDNLDNNIRVLRRIAEILNKFRDYKVQVEGHANPVLRTPEEETDELQPLSEARAESVVNMLVEYGVNRSRLTSMGIGGSRPVIQWEDRDNWWKNRRVEFILIK